VARDGFEQQVQQGAGEGAVDVFAAGLSLEPAAGDLLAERDVAGQA
jgi:hypothetical protein